MMADLRGWNPQGAQGRGGESGVPFEETIWQVARWRDGTAIWVKSYRDRAEALEAAELSK